MRIAVVAFSLVALLVPTATLLAQKGESTDSGTEVEASTPRNHIALDLGGSFPTGSLSYVRQVKDTDFSVGGGLGYAWELNIHTFGAANVWQVAHLESFVRYQGPQVLQLDLGATLMRYLWADDCDCWGTFIGLHSAAMVGYGFVFIGANARVGWKSDDRWGSEFGLILSPQVRIVLPWG